MVRGRVVVVRATRGTGVVVLHIRAPKQKRRCKWCKIRGGERGRTLIVKAGRTDGGKGKEGRARETRRARGEVD